jgi:Zn-dependent protease with chaperone function
VAPRTFPRYGSAVVTPTAPSTATPPAPEATFARTFVWPALWVFLLPVVGLGFTTFHLEKWAYELREEIRAEQAKAPTIPPEQLEQQLGAIDLGAVAWERCGPLGFNEEPQGLWSGFCGQMLQFTWVQRIGAALLGLATLVFLGLLATIAWADRSPRHQHRAFHLGWTLLRGFSLPHLAGQGLILLFLSFWGTALTMNMYVPKLILMAGILGFLAAAAAVGALWARHHHVPTEHGVVLDPARAPAFFARMRELADRAGTAPPKNVVLGIDDNFFVTEVPLLVAAQLPTPQRPVVETQRLEGRTLYASLSLLRAMDRAEADAVLVHELGHFAQGDTLRSQQMNPLLRRFQAYLSTLAQTFTFGIGSCMVAFYALFERIMKRRSREAELTADRLAAKLIGPSPVAEALLKVGAYMRYRAQTESRILESMTTQELRLAQRVVEGFSRFVAEPSGRSELLSSLLHGGTPHPFDSHPPLEERLRNLGIEAPSSDALTRLAQRPAETACDDILDAEVIEQGLWTAYEERFQADHDFLIALRLAPKTPEEIAQVERHFPPVEYPSKVGVVRLDWRGLQLPGGVEIPYADIATAQTKDLFVGGKALVLELRSGPRQQLKLRDFLGKGDQLLGDFARFYQRHEISQQPAPAPVPEPGAPAPPPEEPTPPPSVGGMTAP